MSSTIVLSDLLAMPIESRHEPLDAAAIYFVLTSDAVLYVGQMTRPSGD
jgi:hypothetical protein